MLVATALLLSLIALSLGYWERRQLRACQPSDMLSSSSPWHAWLSIGILFICEAGGVAASFYVRSVPLITGSNLLVLSLILAAAKFVGAIAGRTADAPIRPIEPFLYFKDGFLWPTALPLLAARFEAMARTG